MPDDIADYMLDHYGTCDLGRGCYWKPGCLKREWVGRLCQHWHPLGVTSMEELHAALAATKE